jgi:Flp pilus assembly protein TadG
MKRLFSNTLAKFKADETASLTMEFVLILPLLMTWFIGSILCFDAFNSKATAQRTSHPIADIISRQTETSNTFIDLLLVVQSRMMPREQIGTVRISSIRKDAAGDLELLWTHSSDGTSIPLVIGDIPLAIIPEMANNESILLIDTTVPFVPISDWVGFTATEWENRVAIKARFVEPLPNPDFP